MIKSLSLPYVFTVRGDTSISVPAKITPHYPNETLAWAALLLTQHRPPHVLFCARESTEGEDIVSKMEEWDALVFLKGVFFIIWRRHRLAGELKCKCHQGRPCESRAAEIEVIYLNICFCMACCFCSPEDMQRRGMWQTDGAGEGLAEPG